MKKGRKCLKTDLSKNKKKQNEKKNTKSRSEKNIRTTLKKPKNIYKEKDNFQYSSLFLSKLKILSHIMRTKKELNKKIGTNL